MKKVLLLSSVLTAASLHAQTTYYWPGQRATEITSGAQYFIYNTANDGKDRSFFLYSDGSTLKTNNVSPNSFFTAEDKFLFTANKPETPNAPTHWYLNSVHGIVGHGGQTNNTEIRDLYIAPWFGNDEISKSGAQSEDEEGNLVNPNEVNTHVWAVMSQSTGGNYWNGNEASAGLGSAWTTWSQAHPYAFYTVESREVDDQAVAYSQELTNRTGLISEIAFNLQQVYGMVQEGNKYFSNYPETTAAENSSYANLIDGDDNSYFHSSWSAPGGADDPKHFLRAELTNPNANGFYLITKRRTQNNNNRPTTILVEGCNEADGAYTTLATLTELPTSADEYYYFSNKIANTQGYKYIRFTPQEIAGNTRFFTYSEFYLIESTEETDATLTAIKSLYDDCRGLSVKEENYESTLLTAGNAVTEKNDVMASMLIKVEGRNLLAENAENHAADPELGQYPTSAYNALQAIIDDNEATREEIEAAVKTFKFSINAPVFTINGNFEGGYTSKGKSIYYKADDATYPLWWNKVTNKYDKTMLWKFAGATTTTAEAGKTYSVMNLSDQVYFWDVDSLQVTQTDPANQEGIVLLKTKGNNTPVHADSHGYIVRWNNTASDGASAWTLEYVGESYDIEQINEDQLAAYSELKDLVTACAPFEGKIGSGLNQFSSEGLEEALAAAEEIVATDFYAHPELEVVPARDALKAAKESLTANQPKPGFYRIKSVSKEKYISSAGNVDTRQKLVAGTADNTTVFYLSADNHLTASTLCNMNYISTTDDNLGGVYSFGINNNGYYQITVAGQTAPLYAHNDPNEGDVLTYDFNGGNYADRLANAWTLEEVTNEAEQITLSKEMTAEYATLAAPVALNIPAGVKAYTVTVDAAQESAILEEVADVIPAGTAVVLKKDGAETAFEFTFAAEGTTTNANNLIGVYAQQAVAAEVNAYVLGNGTNGIGFYQMNAEDRTMGANKAYLVLPAEASAIRSITIGGPTTGIEDTVAEGAAQEEYYDLQGRRVMNPTKGIYVTKSGKKVVFNK